MWRCLGVVLLVGCETKPADRSPPAPQPPGPQPVNVDAAPAPVEPATPKSKRGLIVYLVQNVRPGQPIAADPLALFDPDGTQPIATTIERPADVVVGQHVIAGRRGQDGEAFVLDLRSPTLVAKKSVEYIEYITPDDKLVTRCSGGIGRPFKICVSDGDPLVWRSLFEEPKRGEYDIGVVAWAGRDIVHGNYTQLSKLPAFSIRISDKKRTDYPGLIRTSKEYMIEPAYSPNGTKAASCMKDLLITTLDGSAKPQTIELDGEPVRCECRFSHDDTKLACSILYEAKESGIDSLWLWNLATKAKTLIAKELAIGSFVWSPDGTQLAFVGTADNPDRWVIRTATVDGKTVKDLVTVEVKNHLVDLAGWTAP